MKIKKDAHQMKKKKRNEKVKEKGFTMDKEKNRYENEKKEKGK